MKNINATTVQDSSDQDDKGKSDDVKSNADEKKCNTEQQQQFGLAASPVSASELQGSLARQFQNMMAVMHTMQSTISGVASFQAKMDSKLVSINSRIEAIELHKIPSEAQNYGIPVSTAKLNPGFGFGRLAVPN